MGTELYSQDTFWIKNTFGKNVDPVHTSPKTRPGHDPLKSLAQCTSCLSPCGRSSERADTKRFKKKKILPKIKPGNAKQRRETGALPLHVRETRAISTADSTLKVYSVHKINTGHKN